MYTREKKIKALKVKNVICIVIGLFLIITSVSILADLISFYHDQLLTVVTAKATPECILDIIIGTILLVTSGVSRKRIGDANFYSGYFEMDLDGFISYKELAEVTRQSADEVRSQLRLLRKKYMKGFELKVIGNEEQVVLDSKIAVCECKNCAARIEKRMYFTGVCPYCDSSDLHAKVLSGNRFYSIENQISKGTNKPDFYAAKNIGLKKGLMAGYFGLAMFVIIIFFIMGIDQMSKYNNEEYLIDVLFSEDGPRSFELIRADLISMVIWSIFIVIGLIPVAVNRFKNIRYISVADACANYLARCKRAIIPIHWLPTVNVKENKLNGVKLVHAAMRRRYLNNCTFEMHEGELKIALAKKIVKDKCPSCGGAITGAVNEHYRCRYCNNLIMDVVVKK